MKLGLLLPRSGPAGMWAAGCEGAALVAVAELNAAGDVPGREVEIVSVDCGAGRETAEAAAARLRAQERVDAVIGMQPSDLRGAVRRGLAGAVPYIYTPQYEGGWCGPATLAIGPPDEDLLGPAIAWMVGARRASRFFFVGNDYIWPRVAHGTTDAALRAARAVSVGERLIGFGADEYDAIFDAIRAARADAVITVLLGEEAARFHRAFAEAGLARRVLRLAMALDETLLLAIGPDNAENLFAVQTYFAGLAPRGRERMLALYARAFGATRPPVNVFSLGCYDGVHAAAALARAAGSTDRAAILRSLRAPPPALRRFADPRRRRLLVGEADGTAFRVRAAL